MYIYISIRQKAITIKNKKNSDSYLDKIFQVKYKS